MRLLALLLPCALSAMPAPGALQEFRTPSGLRVVLDERHERPLVRLELRVTWGEGEGPEGGPCAGGWMRAVLDRCGAGGFTRPALERALVDRGLRLGLKAERRSLAWSMLADSQGQEDAFAYLAHAVFRPSLAEGFAAVRQDPKRTVAPEIAFRVALGLPAEGGTCDLELPAFLALHRRLVRPERAVLVIQGDLSLMQARQLVLLHLGTWAPAPEPPLQGGRAPIGFVARQALSGREKAAWAGSLPPEGEARTRAAHVLLALLLERGFRGGSGEPIAVEAPRPDGDTGPILFRTLDGASADPERLLRERLERLASRGFSAAELEGAKAQWRAERIALALHPEDQLSAWACRFLGGDPGGNLEDVRLDEVNAALRARIAPPALHWLVQGN